MLNGSPLNSAPLNGAAGTAAPEPEYVVRGQAFVWRLRLLVDGVDWTSQLTGGVDIDREEGAAAVGGFDLCIASGPVVPPDWKGKPVSIDYISTSAGVTTEERRYTGRIAQASWNPVTRLLSCELSDQIQQRVEAMTVAQIDALVGGDWSVDVFEPVEGRSHWDYAVERMGTRTASLDCSPAGGLRVTSWYAVAPHFIFGPGTTLYQSVALQQSDLDSTTNRVEIEFSYRYNRLWQRNQNYHWTHPGTQGMVGIGGFCAWRADPTELPSKDMVEQAASGNGQTAINLDYYSLPLTMADPCGTGVGWTNIYDDLLLGVSWTGARRWVQAVTETYSLTLATTAGQADTGRIVQRAAYTVDVENDEADVWTEEPITNGVNGNSDLTDDARRNAALTVALRMAQVEIVAAHRETTLSWQVPTSLAMGIDLTHTLEVNDQGARAIGKCRRIVDSFDLGSGQAVTTLSIAIMRGGGVSDPLTLPDRLGAPSEGGGGSGVSDLLPTQLGGRTGIPPYDDEMDGFAGNYSQNNPNAETFPRRLTASVDEIAAADRDENQLSSATLYRVGIPNDTLEL